MSRILARLTILLCLLFCLPLQAMAQSYNVVDSSGDAWPQDVIGTYTENGTFNGRPCYEGPNGYWLYYAEWQSNIFFWDVGKPLGTGEINSIEVKFYYDGTSATPPLNVNFSHTNNALGAIKVTTSGGSAPPTPALYSVYSGEATNQSFTCRWSDVSSATGYKLDVSTSASFSSFVAGYNGKVIVVPEGTPLGDRPRSCMVSGLSPGTTYYYRIRSYNGFGESGNSSTCNVTTIPGSPSVQPATNVTQAGFRGNWTSQSGASSYKFFVSSSSDFSSYIINTTATSNYYDATGLTPNTLYYYRVQAVNSSGESAVSSSAQVTTGPAAPVMLPAENIQSGSFTVTWQASSAATGYYIDVAADSSFSQLVAGYSGKDAGNNTSCLVNQNIQPYTTYYLRVRAYNNNGVSTNSASVSITTSAIKPEASTASVTNIDKYSAQANGNITDPGAPHAEQHGFCWNTTGMPTISHSKTEEGAVSGAGTFASAMTGLLPDTRYYVRTYATNLAGTAYGDEVIFTTLCANHAPTVTDTAPSLGVTDEDTVFSLLIANFLACSDADAGDQSGIAITALSGGGSWQYSVNGTTWLTPGAVSDSSALLLQSDDFIRYVPDGMNGETAEIIFRAWDRTLGTHGNTADTSINGGTTAFSDNTGTASLTVTDVNDPPTSSDKTVMTDEDVSYTFISADFGFNDVDAGDSLQSVNVSVLPAAGSLTLNGNEVSVGEVISASDISAGKLKFAPSQNASGAGYASFTFSVSDGSAWSASSYAMTIDVADINDGPVITAPATIAVTEDIPGTLTGVSFYDADAGANSVVATFTVSSGTLSAASGAGVTIGGTGTALTAAGTIDSLNSFINAGSLTYTTAQDNTVSQTLNVSVNDQGNTGLGGALTDTVSITLTVIPVNDAPALSANSGIIVNEGQSHTLTNTELRCSDPDNTAAQLIFTISSGPVNGSLLLSGNALPGGSFTQDDIDHSRITYIHGGSETTSDSFTFAVSDGSGGSIGNTVFLITVNPVNNNPVITKNTGLFMSSGVSEIIDNSMLSASDQDNPNSQLTYTINASPANGTLKYNGSATLTTGSTITQEDIDNGLLTYTHDGSETVSDSFTYTISDGAGGSTGGTFSITIEPTVANSGASSISITPGNLSADGETFATITVVLNNINNHPLAGHSVVLEQGGGSSVISPASRITDAAGTAVFTVKSIRAETVTYTARDDTGGISITDTVQAVFQPVATVSPTSGSIIEGGDMQYQVALVSQPFADVTVNIAAGSQLAVDRNVLTFTEANYNVPQLVNITAIDDDLIQGPRTDTVAHSVYSADTCYSGMTMPDITVSIADNDSPGISVIQSNGFTQVTEGAGEDDYSVVLNTKPTDSVIVNSTGGSELNISPDSLTFLPGNWNTPQTVRIWAVDDNILEGNHYGTVTHSVYSNDPNYNGYPIPPFNVQIFDNDASSNANLSGLALSSGTLTPAFDPAVTSYTDSVEHDISNITVTPTPQDGSANVLVNGQPVAGGSQSGPIGLLVGENTITVLVTAQDNSTKEYVIIVSRSSSHHHDRNNRNQNQDRGTTETVKAHTESSVSYNKVTVDIPANTLPADAAVSITPLAASEVENTVPEGLRVKMFSDVYEISTSGERNFGNNTITIKIAYDPAKVNVDEHPAIHYFDEKLGQWIKLETELVQENGSWYALTMVNHLTKFAVFGVTGQTAAAKHSITLTLDQRDAAIDGSPYTLDAAPYLNEQAQRTLVPIRFVSEALEAGVNWDPNNNQVTILDGGKVIKLTPGSNQALVDGQPQTLDCAPALLPPGRTFVPLRFISEALGAQVDYEDSSRQIIILR